MYEVELCAVTLLSHVNVNGFWRQKFKKIGSCCFTYFEFEMGWLWLVCWMVG
jgi:hypothetical protein